MASIIMILITTNDDEESSLGYRVTSSKVPTMWKRSVEESDPGKRARSKRNRREFSSQKETARSGVKQADKGVAHFIVLCGLTEK